MPEYGSYVELAWFPRGCAASVSKGPAAPESTVTGMELTQIQVEAIDAASREGPVDPGSFAQILLLDGPVTVEAFAALEQRGLMRQDDVGCFP
jgi:hypothetical protein